MVLCPVCGKDFVKNRSWQVYCGRKCKWNAQDKRRAEVDAKRVLVYKKRYGVDLRRK